MSAHERVEVSLVVPVHHCTGHLEPTLDELARFLRHAPMRTEVLLVDDHGSDASAAALLRDFARRDGVCLLRNDRNRGKGYSVRRGMLEATGRYRVFTDADLAYPLDEVWRVVARLQHGVDVAIACRVHEQSEYILSASYLRYLYTRHLMSRVFNGLVRLTLLPGILDTQAGLKGFSARAAQDVFPQLRIWGFGFDLECLYLARRAGYRIEQLPVRFCYADEPSTVRFVRDGVTMAADLARIRWRDITGAYRTPTPRAPIRRIPTPRPARAMPPLHSRSDTGESILSA